MSSTKKLQVFVSSTYTDLKAERQAAVEAILKAGHIPAGMELFSAGNESQLSTIRRWIDDSDVFMLILGARYGSIDPTEKLSYIEIEYNYALANAKPMFATVISKDATNRKAKEEGLEVIERERPQEWTAFQEKVLSRTSSFFSDPRDIKLAVHETLADFERRLTFTGWISGRNIEDTKPLLEQIFFLRRDNEAMVKEIEELKKRRLREKKRDPQADGLLAQKCDNVSKFLYEAGATFNRLRSERHWSDHSASAVRGSSDAFNDARIAEAREEEKIQKEIGPTVQSLMVELHERGIEMDLFGFALKSYDLPSASYLFAELASSLREGTYLDRRFTFDRMGRLGGLGN